MRGLVLCLILFVALSNNVFGYIDPGTGATIIGSIWPVIVAFFSAVFAFIVKYFWKPIKEFVLRIFNFGKKGK